MGYIVRGPLGGLAWHHLQYLLGLAALGHDVWFLEDSDDYPGCYSPDTHVLGTDPAYGLAFLEQVFTRLGIADRWAYHDAHSGRWFGPAAASLRVGQPRADLVLNLSGANPIRDWTRDIPRRVFIDTDPAFTQLRHIADHDRRALAEQHTHFFSFGENFGQPTCTIPDDGFPWRPTRQPVTLDHWPTSPPAHSGLLTSVMQWDSYRTLRHGDREFGMKSASFQPYFDVPGRTGTGFRLALGGASAPREELIRYGWEIVDPLLVTRDPWTYQEFIAASRGEFGIAKAGYVTSRSGWFSERSAVYLASGRPVIVQDTGFTDWLQASDGVLPFSTPAEALAQVERLNSNLAWHCRAARQVAADYFDARDVLGRLIDESMS